MKKKMIMCPADNYITTGEAKALLQDKESLGTLQKYSVKGSRKTYYFKEDVMALISDKKKEITPKENKTKSSTETGQMPAYKNDELNLEAYVDGSYNKQTGVYGSAVIMLSKGEVVAIKTSHGKKMNSMWNVAGEIAAAALAVKLADELMTDSLVIKYDCEAIEKWPTGAWRIKNEYAAQYVDFMNKKRPFSIAYDHIKAHTGDKYNELADDMAQRAAGLVPECDAKAVKIAQNKIDEDVLRVKYQVKDSCIKAIKSFYEKDKHSFKDYVELKAGTGDNFSSMWSQKEFEGIISDDASSYVNDTFSEENDILNAFRWIARGLDVNDAIKKVNVNNEIYKKK